MSLVPVSSALEVELGSVARELAPAGLRSSPQTTQPSFIRCTRAAGFTTASPPSGSKRPRHRNCAPKEGGSVFQAGLYGGYTVLAVKTADTRQPALKVFRVITQPLPGNVLRRL